MKAFNLNGKVAIITGGSKGIGKACAYALSEAGAITVLVSRHLAEARQASDEIEKVGSESFALEADVRNPIDVEKMVAKTIQRFGKIDILVNNAGINVRKPVLEFTTDDWNNILATNLVACHICTKAVCSHMIPRKEGNIINIASVIARAVLPERAAYAASKAGLVQLTKYLAVELAPFGIRCNAIAPGPIESGMRQQMASSGAADDNFMDLIPMKRIGQPSEIGGTLVYLASEASSYITGAIIFIDGGWSATG